jgi:hypothetical protein
MIVLLLVGQADSARIGLGMLDLNQVPVSRIRVAPMGALNEALKPWK